MWQAHIARLPTFEERKHAVDNEVPKHMRERVIDHLKTVRALRMKGAE